MQGQKVKINEPDVSYTTGQAIDTKIDNSNPAPKGIIFKENYTIYSGPSFAINSSQYTEDFEEVDEEILRAIEKKNYSNILSPIV